MRKVGVRGEDAQDEHPKSGQPEGEGNAEDGDQHEGGAGDVVVRREGGETVQGAERLLAKTLAEEGGFNRRRGVGREQVGCMICLLGMVVDTLGGGQGNSFDWRL